MRITFIAQWYMYKITDRIDSVHVLDKQNTISIVYEKIQAENITYGKPLYKW